MNTQHLWLWFVAGSLLVCPVAVAAENTPVNAARDAGMGTFTPAAEAVNDLGCRLLTAATPTGNALLSPYSIQTALAMTYAGAAGDTRAEMAKVLAYPADESELHQSFAQLRAALEKVARDTAARAEALKQHGGRSDAVVLTVANRLFGQQGFDFRPPFLDLVKDKYQAPLQALDFMQNPAAAARTINAWVEEQTQKRIADLIPPDALQSNTRLLLVNAVYLKAPWAAPFKVAATQPAPFYVERARPFNIPTMNQRGRFGYSHQNGFTAVTLPYTGGELQFLILLPDATNGLAGLESKLTPRMLSSCAKATPTDLVLHLPKLKLTPPSMPLSRALQSLGMKSAFDIPQGSANFDRMAPRRSGDYLSIAEVFHKTFLDLGEQGTEAAAATAVVVTLTSARPQNAKPVEVRVDHPFLFAIQHRSSGACLFLGRVADPRH